jgi:hypothetical protein
MRAYFSFGKQITRRTFDAPSQNNTQDACVTSYKDLFSIFLQTDNAIDFFEGCYEFKTSFNSEH